MFPICKTEKRFPGGVSFPSEKLYKMIHLVYGCDKRREDYAEYIFVICVCTCSRNYTHGDRIDKNNIGLV